MYKQNEICAENGYIFDDGKPITIKEMAVFTFCGIPVLTLIVSLIIVLSLPALGFIIYKGTKL